MCRINQASNKAIQKNNREAHTEQALTKMKRMAPVSLNEAIEQSAQLCTSENGNLRSRADAHSENGGAPFSNCRA
jgi:hypothetical protein